MSRSIDHSSFDNAKKNKKDEFYTQYEDIERELRYYVSLFKNKSVYCNCDDAERSNFCKYFVNNFNELGLKKLVCSGYNGSPGGRGSYYEYDGTGEEPLCRERITLLAGNGDFRSEECIDLLKQADIVVTNPPFSLFRDYLKQAVTFGKSFLVISNVTAITYKEVYPLIKSNKVWLGVNLGRGISGFAVPDDYELYGLETKINEKGERIVSPNNCMWLTNLDNCKRNGFLVNGKTYRGNESDYPRYDNYDAIHVDKTQNIPLDYDGVMGVPTTFLHKYNPKQFEIVRFRKGSDGKDLKINGKTTFFRILVRKRKNHTVPEEAKGVFKQVSLDYAADPQSPEKSAIGDSVRMFAADAQTECSR